MSGLRNIDCVNHPNQTTIWFPHVRFATSPSTVMINIYFIANNATINKIIKIKRDTLTFGTRFFSLALKICILNIFFYILTEHIYASLPMSKLILQHPPYSIKYWTLWILCQAVFEQRDVFKQRDMYTVYKIKLVNGV